MNSSSGLRVAPINQSGGDGAILFRASAAGEALFMIAGIGNVCGDDHRCDVRLHFRVQTGFHFLQKCSIDLPKADAAESA
jgi:hypothetical protein